MIMINSLSSFCHYAFGIPILIDVISHYLETTFQGQDMSDNDYPLFNFSPKKKLTMEPKILNRDKNCTLHAGHDYLSNHLWVSLLRYRNLIVSSDTHSNFTKGKDVRFGCSYLVILLYRTLSVLVICQSNSKQ